MSRNEVFMNRRVINTILLAAAAAVLTVGGVVSFVKRQVKESINPNLPSEIARASSEFKQQTGDRASQAEKLLPYLKPGMPRQTVIELLGDPRPEFAGQHGLFYPVGWSEAITVHFDDTGKVIHVEGLVRDYTNGIERVWPLICIGMHKTEVMTRLGGPQVQLNDHTTWQYKPSNDPAVYTITFDEEGKVKSLNPTREEFQRRMEERRQQRPKTPN
jgi:outer membrane protein assembly factor BamE (lipoprotein component of BamABCDE complex)